MQMFPILNDASILKEIAAFLGLIYYMVVMGGMITIFIWLPIALLLALIMILAIAWGGVGTLATLISALIAFVTVKKRIKNNQLFGGVS